jgi:hypothetical protein
VLFVYLIASIVVAWLGRNRILRFWGNLVLALILTPQGLTRPAKTVTG